MVTGANIISYLKSENVSFKEKEIFISKKRKLLTKVLKCTSSITLIECLFESKIPKSAKIMISKEIDSRNLTSDEISIIDNFLKNKSSFKENDLLKRYYPKVVKTHIINRIYTCDIIDLLNSGKKSNELKKIIIDSKVDGPLLTKVLLSINNDELKNYILATKFNSLDNILAVLYDASSEVCEVIINRFVNENNILDILVTPLSELVKNEIIEKKHAELVQIISRLSMDKIMKIVTSSEIYPKEVYRLILEYKEDVIKKAINKMSLAEFRRALCKTKDSKVVDIFIKEHPRKVKLSLLFTKQIAILPWLYSDSIPMDIKKFILDNKYNDVVKAINNRSITSLKIGYLRKSENIPDEVVKLTLKLKREELMQDIKRKPDYIIISEILFGNYCELYKEFIIDTIDNAAILRNLLMQSDENIVALVMTSKKDLITNILNTIAINELLCLSYFENDYAKELIYTNYKNVILARLKTCNKDDLYRYLNAYTTNDYIKAIILNMQNIPEEDIFNVLAFIKYNDTSKVLENYNAIKEFIVKNNISFTSFMEYGIGSEIYSNWFDNIIDIIKNNKEKDFYKAFNYLLNELYLEDSNKENMVYIILNFLEILSSFDRCNTLIMNLVNDNVLLDKESRSNLKYLFKSSLTDIKTLEDLKLVRIKALKQNEEIINKSTSLEELKTLFNKLVLNDSFVVLDYIGGIKTLVALKNYNKESSKFGEFIDNLIKCSSLIEKVKACNNIEVLRTLLKHFVVDNPKELIILETTFIKYKKNMQKLFEIDAKLNLSKVSSFKDLGLLNEELSQKYGGEVFDLRGTNYTLYAHVLSRYEKMDMLVCGTSSGDKNFISVSPISYLGQKYYFDRCGATIAIDTLPTGSFIYSSLSNMSTNYNISNNSAEVKEARRNERGILETSAVTLVNSEVLLYREGVKACGLILPDGREPSPEELEYHEKYNLPFIITQEVMNPCESVKKVFKLNDVDINFDELPKKLDGVLQLLSTCFSVSKNEKVYTGREIAIITDAHALYEPTLAVLENIRQAGITEIYSLGDNIGEGANPHEVMQLLDKYNVSSIAGNSEYYNILGTAPFTYFDKDREENQAWTYDKLTTEDLNTMKLYKPSIDLTVGDKMIALCHFANDIRWDYSGNNSTWAYQQNFKKGVTSKQFLHTNSQKSEEIMKNRLSNNPDEKQVAGILNSLKNPIFDGKKVTDYDAIVQGHVHFHLDDYLYKTNILTLRAVAMGYTKKDDSKACYYVIKERNDGAFDIEKRLVDFNHNLLYANLYSSDIPHKEKVLKFTKTI